MVIVGDNQYPLSCYRPVAIPKGSRIRISRFNNGARGYLCIAGGIQSPSVLGSRSALVSLPDAGLGRMLKQGDRLDFDESAAAKLEVSSSSTFNLNRLFHRESKVMRIVEGAHAELFTSAHRSALCEMPFSV